MYKAFARYLYYSVRHILAFPKQYWQYEHDRARFCLLSSSTNNMRLFAINRSDDTPCLYDQTTDTPFDPHYIYHPAWAARIIARNKPTQHVDISSILAFCTIVSAFVPVKFYDFRPASLKLDNLQSEHADLTQLHFANNSIESLSCMHTVEHIGLGRYGDPIDPEGDMKAMRELARVLAINGTLLFVVPIGKPRVQFNAHRVYSYNQILTAFQGLKLEEFSLIPDKVQSHGMLQNANSALADQQNYGCGCFWFSKKLI